MNEINPFKLKYYGEILTICLLFSTFYMTVISLILKEYFYVLPFLSLTIINLYSTLFKNEVAKELIEKFKKK